MDVLQLLASVFVLASLSTNPHPCGRRCRETEAPVFFFSRTIKWTSDLCSNLQVLNLTREDPLKGSQLASSHSEQRRPCKNRHGASSQHQFCLDLNAQASTASRKLEDHWTLVLPRILCFSLFPPLSVFAFGVRMLQDRTLLNNRWTPLWRL